MSGTVVGRALARRFDEVRQTEIERLQRKLAALSPADRAGAESIIADVIGAIARVPATPLASAQHRATSG